MARVLNRRREGSEDPAPLRHCSALQPGCRCQGPARLDLGAAGPRLLADHEAGRPALVEQLPQGRR
eukprot:7938097-Alexandrium_andersonii.AAC.1